MHRPETPLMMIERLSAARPASRSGARRPVTVPRSWPTVDKWWPTVPGSSIGSSVGNGPLPTRVV
jgi:hypothetical protein